jgi:hypothetical protein
MWRERRVEAHNRKRWRERNLPSFLLPLGLGKKKKTRKKGVQHH